MNYRHIHMHTHTQKHACSFTFDPATLKKDGCDAANFKPRRLRTGTVGFCGAYPARMVGCLSSMLGDLQWLPFVCNRHWLVTARYQQMSHRKSSSKVAFLNCSFDVSLLSKPVLAGMNQPLHAVVTTLFRRIGSWVYGDPKR